MSTRRSNGVRRGIFLLLPYENSASIYNKNQILRQAFVHGQIGIICRVEYLSISVSINTFKFSPTNNIDFYPKKFHKMGYVFILTLSTTGWRLLSKWEQFFFCESQKSKKIFDKSRVSQPVIIISQNVIYFTKLLPRDVHFD